MKNVILIIMISLVSMSLLGQSFLSQYTGQEIETILNYSNGVTAGTAQASKAIILDASKNITGINNVTIIGEINIPNDTFITAIKYAGGGNYDIIKLNQDDNIEFGKPVDIGELFIPLASGVATLVDIDADGASAGTKHGITIMANTTDTLFSVITEDDGVGDIQNTFIRTYGNLIVDGDVTIVSNLILGGITKLNSVSIDLTPAEIHDLEISPILLVATQGANTIIEFVSAMLIWDYVDTDFVVTNADNKFVIQYDLSTDVSDAINMNIFLEGSNDAIRWMLPAATKDTDLLANQGRKLELFNEGTGDVTGGDNSTFTVKITYRVHSTGL